jgi:hypothetical protein
MSPDINFHVNAAAFGSLKQSARTRVNELIAQRSLLNINKERLLSDATQFVTLSSLGKTYDDLFVESVSAALEANDYAIGRKFDVFTADAVYYGQHVADVAASIQPDDVVNAATHFKSTSLSVRRTLTIESELRNDPYPGTPVAGWDYYVFSAVDERLHDGEKTRPNMALNSRATVSLENRLYISPNDGEFYLYKGDGTLQSVWLGDTSPMDEVVADVRTSGILDSYKRVMNGMEYNTKYHLARIPQLLFWEVFKTLKALSVPAEVTSEVTSEEETPEPADA